MPSHKKLKSITHNFAHSFISLMNWVKDDYFLGHLQKQMRKTKIDKIEIDVLNNIIKPAELINDALRQCINNQINWFPKMVTNSGSSMEFIKSAQIVIQFNLNETRLSSFKNYIENPYLCQITLIDDRNKEYTRIFEGWWFPET